MSQAIELKTPPAPPALRLPQGIGGRFRSFVTGVRSVFDLGPRRYSVGRHGSAAGAIAADLGAVLGDFRAACDTTKGRTTDGP